jgi:hypothetical protein
MLLWTPLPILLKILITGIILEIIYWIILKFILKIKNIILKCPIVIPAKAGIQQASGSEPKDSFAPADAGALDPRFRGDDNVLYADASSALRMASVMAVVPTLFMPGCMMSPVRSPAARAPAMALSSRSASLPMSKE